jgi:hypothetical protein
MNVQNGIMMLQEFNIQYVHIVEERLNEALTTYEKTYDGSLVRRTARRLKPTSSFMNTYSN